MATERSLSSLSVPENALGLRFELSPKHWRQALVSGCRVLVLAVAAGLPVLSISAHVFGVVSLHFMALYGVLPAAALAVLLASGRSREAALARRGMLAGLIAVAAYDSTRLPFVLTGIWADFIPRVGGWAVGNDRPNAFLGYLWRYVGNGGGIGIFFVMFCAVLGLRRRLVVAGVCYGVFVWSGLMGTVAFAADGPKLLFPLTPLSVTLSLIGHLVYGSVLGWVYAHMIRRNPGLADLRIHRLPTLSFMSSKEEPVEAAGKPALARTSTSMPIRPGRSFTSSYEGEFAMALNNLGGWLREVGRREEALAATEESVGLLRRVASANPAVYEPVLAGSLNRLAVQLAEFGRYLDALPFAEESVALYRRLIAHSAGVAQPGVAETANSPDTQPPEEAHPGSAASSDNTGSELAPILAPASELSPARPA